jgi:hypothetical protein
MKAILESAHNKAEILPMRRSTRPKTHAKRHVDRTAFQCLVAEVRFLWSDLSSSPPVFWYIGVCLASVILH